MRLTPRAAALLLVLYTCLPDAAHAASISSQPAVCQASFFPAAATLTTSFPKPHLRFKERKGTMGFVYAVVLGPFGYFGVQLFSPHSEGMRYQAARGFRIWTLVVASAAIFAACVALKDNGDLSSDLISALWASF
jgi:hypothetical protein